MKDKAQLQEVEGFMTIAKGRCKTDLPTGQEPQAGKDLSRANSLRLGHVLLQNMHEKLYHRLVGCIIVSQQ